MKCFHHGDADGKCAAFWVSERFPHMTANDFILIDYGMDIDWFYKFEKDEPIIIVDFSFEPEDMRKILTKTTNVTWIDHHKSAIEKYALSSSRSKTEPGNSVSFPIPMFLAYWLAPNWLKPAPWP